MSIFDNDAPQGLRGIDWSNGETARATIADNFKATEGQFKALHADLAEGKRERAELKEAAVKAGRDLTAITKTLAELNARTSIEQGDAPTGPASHMRRFVVRDSSGAERLNLFDSKIRYRGQEVEMPGLLSTTENYGDSHNEIKKLLLAAHVATAKSCGKSENPRDLRTMRRHAPKLTARLCYLLEHATPHGVSRAAKNTVERIFTDSSGSGAEFVPDEILLPGFEMDALYDPALRLSMDAVEKIPMTGARLDEPFMSGNTRPYLYGSSTSDDPSKYTASSATFATNSTVPQGFAIRYVADESAIDDSMSTLGGLDALRPILVRDLLLGLEDAWINGDTAGTHQDTDLANWNPNSLWGTTSGAGGSGDHRKGFLGLRARGFDMSNTTDFSGATTTAKLFSLAATLDPPHMVSDGNTLVMDYESYLADILVLTEVLTVDKIGVDSASVRGIRVAKLGPWSIELTPVLAKTFPTTGLYTTSGATGTYVGFNRRRFAIAMRKAIAVDVVRDVERGVFALVGRVRAQIKDRDNGNSVSGTSVKNIAVAINCA